MKKALKLFKKLKVRHYIAALLVVAIIVTVAILRPSLSRTSNVLDDATLDSFKISEVNMYQDEDMYTYEAKVTATKDIDMNIINITFTLDDKPFTIIGYVGKSMKAGEETIIRSSTDVNILNSTDVKYELKK